MAKYRPIFTKMWTDPDFQEYSKDERDIFVYLCTNSETSESGIYPVSCKTISQATEVEQDEVELILRENRLKNIMYDFENKVVFVVNFLHYNGRGRKDLVLKSVYNDYVNVETPLWNEFKKRYPVYFERMLSLGDELERVITDAMSNLTPKHNANPRANPTANPEPNLASNHNSNHTHNNTPVKEMFEIFETNWRMWNDGSYLHDYETEQSVAEVLYDQCLKDRPENPLGLFKEKVIHLMEKHDIKHFVGLPKFWNAAADRDRESQNIEEATQ